MLPLLKTEFLMLVGLGPGACTIIFLDLPPNLADDPKKFSRKKRIYNKISRNFLAIFVHCFFALEDPTNLSGKSFIVLTPG